MNTVRTEDTHMKAEIYTELINDMQAKIFEFERRNPAYMNDEIRGISSRLSEARMESRIYIDDEHFREWERLLAIAEGAMARSELFG